MKEKEKKFKDYIRAIEDLNKNIGMFNHETDALKLLDEWYKDLKKVRIEFFEFFKRNIK